MKRLAIEFSAAVVLTCGCAATQPSTVPAFPGAAARVLPASEGKGTWHQFNVVGFPQGIVRAADGDFWVADGDMSSTLSQVTPEGKVTNHIIGYEALEMALDPNGNFWITVGGNEKQIIRVTPKLKVTTFALTDAAGEGITVGGDQNIWFVEQTHIGKITTLGTLKEYPTGETGGSSGITWAEGLVWFRKPNALASLNPQNGSVMTYKAPMFDCGGAIVRASDGALWYTLQTDSAVTLVRFDPKTRKTITYKGPSNYNPYGAPAGMIQISDGSLWYTVQRLSGGTIKYVVGGGLVRFDMQTKTFTAYPAPKDYGWDWDVAAGPGGTVWATASGTVAELLPR